MAQSAKNDDNSSNKNSEQILKTFFVVANKKCLKDGTNNGVFDPNSLTSNQAIVGVSYNIPNSSTKCNEVNMICGIDSFYYYIGFNPDNIEDLEARQKYNLLYSQMILDYDNSKIDGNPYITILDMNFRYVRKEQGHIIFEDSQGLYSIGFKSLYVNTNLEPVYIELGYKGIYSMGISKVVELIDSRFKGYIGTDKLTTRVDINTFIQYDFSYIKETNFASAKTQTRPFYKKSKLETVYIGKRPHLLRLYNKTIELEAKGGDKEPLLLEYFKNNGLDTNEPIWNLEFQINRAFLKSRGINTVDEVLSNIDNLFIYSMNKIRLTDSDINYDIKNKSRIETSAIWTKITNSYNYDNNQILADLKSVSENKTTLDIKRFKERLYKLIKGAYKQNLNVGIKTLANTLGEYLKDNIVESPEELDLKEYEYCEKTQTVLIELNDMEIEEQIQIMFKKLANFMVLNRCELTKNSLSVLLKEYRDGN